MSTTTRRRTGPRVAVSPLGYSFELLNVAPLEQLAQAYADLHHMGYTAVRADVPDDLPLDDYAHWLRLYQLEPAIGVFAATFDGDEQLSDIRERARRTAARHTRLGLDRVMLIADPVPDRVARPAVGAGAAPGRLDDALERMGETARTLAAEGLRPLLHPRVSGLVETEDEVVTTLETVGADLLGFGPDTGHLRWAGADPAGLVARYVDRVGAVHLSDVLPDYAQPTGRGRGRSYHELVATGRVWTEPGTGVAELDRVLAALPADFDGDLVIEIERPSIDSVYAAHRRALEWVRRALAPAT